MSDYRSLHTYAYNALGNMIYGSNIGAYLYGETGYANPHAATDIASTTLSYDNNGNLTAYGDTSYAWNYRNALTEVEASQATTIYDDAYAVNWDENSWNTSVQSTSTQEVYEGTYANKVIHSAEWAGFNLENPTGTPTMLADGLTPSKAMNMPGTRKRSPPQAVGHPVMFS